MHCSARHLGLDVARNTRATVGTLDVFDEHLLNEPVCFVDVHIVVAFRYLSDFLEGAIAEDLARLAERLEGVFRLPGHHYVADKSEEVIASGRVSKVTRERNRL